MGQFSQRTAHIIGIAIKRHDYGHRIIWILFVDTPYLVRHHVCLVYIGVSLQQLQVACPLLCLVLRRGQQVVGDAQLLFAILVKDIQQVLRRTVVLEEVMETALAAALFQHGEGVCLSTHKRKDGLLRITQIHHRRIIIRKQVDDGQLQRVQVLHLVYLQPFISAPWFHRPWLCLFCLMRRRISHHQRVVSPQQQVLEIQQVVLLLIQLVLPRRIQALQQRCRLFAQQRLLL